MRSHLCHNNIDIIAIRSLARVPSFPVAGHMQQLIATWEYLGSSRSIDIPCVKLPPCNVQEIASGCLRWNVFAECSDGGITSVACSGFQPKDAVKPGHSFVTRYHTAKNTSHSAMKTISDGEM